MGRKGSTARKNSSNKNSSKDVDARKNVSPVASSANTGLSASSKDVDERKNNLRPRNPLLIASIIAITLTLAVFLLSKLVSGGGSSTATNESTIIASTDIFTITPSLVTNTATNMATATASITPTQTTLTPATTVPTFPAELKWIDDYSCRELNRDKWVNIYGVKIPSGVKPDKISFKQFNGSIEAKFDFSNGIVEFHPAVVVNKGFYFHVIISYNSGYEWKEDLYYPKNSNCE